MHLNFYGTLQVPKHNGRHIDKRVTISALVEGNSMKLGASICAANDNFTKQLGRKIAQGRAVKRPFRQISLKENEDINIGKFFCEMCKEMDQNNYNGVKLIPEKDAG